jgi:hypothetical protein
MFQFRKNEYKKTYNILINDFTKSIFKNKKKKSIFLNLKQTHQQVIYFGTERVIYKLDKKKVLLIYNN